MDLYLILLKYYYLTETYDKEIGMMLDRNGVYMPINRKQEVQGQKYAMKIRKELGLLSQKVFNTQEAWKLCKMHYEQLSAEYKRHFNNN